MVDQRKPQRRAVADIRSEPPKKDNVAKAIDHALHEVHAARRDLSMTGFCLQQAEALRRIDRAAARLVNLEARRVARSKGRLVHAGCAS